MSRWHLKARSGRSGPLSHVLVGGGTASRVGVRVIWGMTKVRIPESPNEIRMTNDETNLQSTATPCAERTRDAPHAFSGGSRIRVVGVPPNPAWRLVHTNVKSRNCAVASF